MGPLEWTLIGVGIVVLFFLGMVSLVFFSKDRVQALANGTPAPAPTQPQVVAVQTSSSGTKVVWVRKHGRALAYLFAAVVVFAVALFFWPALLAFIQDIKIPDGISMPKVNAIDVFYILASVVLIWLAIMGALGKGGAAGKWALGIVGVILAFILLPRVLSMIDDRNTSASRSQGGTETVLPLSRTEWSAAISGPRTQCIFFRRPSPDGVLEVQAHPGGKGSWMSWQDWKAGKQNGTIKGDIGWLRFRGDAVVYGFRRRGECG